MIIRVQGAAEVQYGIYYEYDNESLELGKGGMGVVYEGACFRVGNPNEYIPVAIKLITNPIQDFVERAMREASIQIDHPNILRMWGFIPNIEWDAYNSKNQTRYYVVMDRLYGVDLHSLMKGLTIDKSGYNIEYAKELYDLFINDRFQFVRKVMLEVFAAISTLHKAGHVHRDIDPSNVMVTNEGVLKLIDFGISKTVNSGNEQGHKLTNPGAIIGKLDYAAPEIIRGEVDRHNFTTDIYALGIMMYELYTGSLPFGGSDHEIMTAQLEKPIPVKNINNPKIKRIVEKATQKKQSDRYQSIEEMITDLNSEQNEEGEIREGETVIINDPGQALPTWTYILIAMVGCLIGVLLQQLI